MDDEERRKLDETVAELDLRLGGLLGKLGDTLTEMVDRLEAGQDGRIHRTQDFPTSRGPMRAETDIRLRFGGFDTDHRRSGGARQASARPFRPAGQHPGDARSKPAGQGHGSGQPPEAGPTGFSGGEDSVSDMTASGAPGMSRPPHVESYRDGKRWILCADLPGTTLSETDIRVESVGSGEALVVESSGARRYSFRQALPPEARADEMQIVLRNGVLEVVMPTGSGEDAQ